MTRQGSHDRRGLNYAPPAKPGWVYILTNEAMPGMVKIGLTTRTPKERAAELSGATGVPLPFVVAWARAVSDCDHVERAVHRMLDDKRVSGRRESFRVDVHTARQVIEAVASDKLGRRYRPPLPQKRSVRALKRNRGDSTTFWMGLVAVTFLALLAVFKPDLPGWLPVSILRAAVAVEQLHRL